MWTGIFSRKTKPAEAPLPEVDERLALGTLMVRVAKSDNQYKFEEISQIDTLLGHLFSLNQIEAAKMRATCERLEKLAPDTAEFAQLIRDHVDFEHRIEAHEALWQVMQADGVQSDEEMEIIATSRNALGLSEADCTAARGRTGTL